MISMQYFLLIFTTDVVISKKYYMEIILKNTVKNTVKNTAISKKKVLYVCINLWWGPDKSGGVPLALRTSTFYWLLCISTLYSTYISFYCTLLHKYSTFFLLTTPTPSLIKIGTSMWKCFAPLDIVSSLTPITKNNLYTAKSHSNAAPTPGCTDRDRIKPVPA